MDRIDKLCSYLDGCKTFADVGCDHGYCTLYMLKNNLCESAVISDISAKCLDKAERLLSRYITGGKVVSVCCSGLEKVPEDIGQVLIAGMGGDEIVNILKTAYIPASFVFQPMKNARLLREYLLENSASVTVDEMFESGGKFYTVIKGKKGGLRKRYSEIQLKYGLDLQGEVTKKYLAEELKKKQSYLDRQLSENTREEILKEKNEIERILKGEII